MGWHSEYPGYLIDLELPGFQKLSLLWRSELTSILVKNGLPRYTVKNKKYIAAVLEDRVQPEMLHAQISEELFERDYQARGF